MKIELITPAPTSARNGNSITALRWKRMLRELGHQVIMRQSYGGGSCDLMIALHARRSFDSIQRFRKEHPDLPLIVVLTGTDLYRDIRNSSKARKSLELATRVVVLQSKGMAELPKRLHTKTRVIYQSATPTDGPASPARKGFKVCVIGHMRSEKDPLRTAIAARRLPASSQVRVIHVGRALTDRWKNRVLAEIKRNPRYRWLGEMPHWRARQLLAR